MSLISNLVKLQEVDSSIQSIQELQGDLPKNVEELKSNLSFITMKFQMQKKDYKKLKLKLEKFKHFKNRVKKKLAIFKNKFIKLNLIENMMH